jgi:hypothetical protein
MDALAAEHDTLRAQYNALTRTHNELIGVYESAVAEQEQLQRCLHAAASLDEARACL